MAFVREWPPQAVVGCWPRGVPRVASACLLDRAGLREFTGRATTPRAQPGDNPDIEGEWACKAQDPRRFSACCRRTSPGGTAWLGAAGSLSPIGRERRRDGAGWLHREPKGRECRAAQSGKAAV